MRSERYVTSTRTICMERPLSVNNSKTSTIFHQKFAYPSSAQFLYVIRFPGRFGPSLLPRGFVGAARGAGACEREYEERGGRWEGGRRGEKLPPLPPSHQSPRASCSLSPAPDPRVAQKKASASERDLGLYWAALNPNSFALIVWSDIYSQLSANVHSRTLYLRRRFWIPLSSQTLYWRIPISGHSLVCGRGHFWQWRLRGFSFVYALS